jgi:hypothetical protein
MMLPEAKARTRAIFTGVETFLQVDVVSAARIADEDVVGAQGTVELNASGHLAILGADWREVFEPKLPILCHIVETRPENRVGHLMAARAHDVLRLLHGALRLSGNFAVLLDYLESLLGDLGLSLTSH